MMHNADNTFDHGSKPESIGVSACVEDRGHTAAIPLRQTHQTPSNQLVLAVESYMHMQGCCRPAEDLISALQSSSDQIESKGHSKGLADVLLQPMAILSVLCRAVAALAEDPEFHLAELLEPGTIEWIHNPSIFHSRTEVVDGEVSIPALTGTTLFCNDAHSTSDSAAAQ